MKKLGDVLSFRVGCSGWLILKCLATVYFTG